jgi:hypothetical protein
MAAWFQYVQTVSVSASQEMKEYRSLTQPSLKGIEQSHLNLRPAMFKKGYNSSVYFFHRAEELKTKIGLRYDN